MRKLLFNTTAECANYFGVARMEAVGSMVRVLFKQGGLRMPTLVLKNPALDQPYRYDLLKWFVVVHVLALVGCVYSYVFFSGKTIVLAVTLFFLCHLSIRMGVHALYSHGSYKARLPLEIVLNLLFSGTFQNSILWWAGFHRRHHAVSDTEQDPYTVRHGFWWAHCGWLMHSREEVPHEARRLAKNKVLLFQQKYHLHLGVVVGLALPACIAAIWGDLLGGFLVAGFTRLMFQYHCTWVINSVAHRYGGWRYSPHITARTCWLVCAITVGEWNHERHHFAEDDYRLGNTRWYDPDPGKWLIWSLQWVGLTYDLKRVSDEELAARTQKSLDNKTLVTV